LSHDVDDRRRAARRVTALAERNVERILAEDFEV
jgi:hypothetical protein